MEISIQRKWTSPDGKIVVVTTPEQVKYNCYKLPLFQHLVIGEIEAEVKEYDRPAKGQYSAKHIREIVNVKVGGVWILKEQTEEPTSTAPEPPKKAVKETADITHQEPPASDPEKGMFWKEVGEWLRSGKLDMSKSINQTINASYWKRLCYVCGVQIEIPSPQVKKPIKTKPKIT